MSQPLCILCPGQGAQAVGMGRDFFEASETAREVFQAADRVLGIDLSGVCFNGPEDRLNQTDFSQPAIYVTSVACFRALVAAAKLDEAAVACCAGLSLGEYTALHLAGAIGFEEGLRLVAARGRHMQEASTAVPSGMVALVGADEAAAESICAEAAAGEVLAPANFNSPGQIVISGAAGACQRAAALAESRGIKAIPLKVAGAFHSPLMRSAADKMADELANAKISAPRCAVYANVTARPHEDPASIRRLLVDQVVKPVRWEQSMRAMIAASEGRWRFVELAPGRSLAGMARKIDRKLPLNNYSTAEGLVA